MPRAAGATGVPAPKGYVQEIAIPWSCLLKEGQQPPKAGERFVMTIEPNFTLGQNGRMTLKDIFKPWRRARSGVYLHGLPVLGLRHAGTRAATSAPCQCGWPTRGSSR